MFSFEEAYCGLEFDEWVNVVEFITTEVPKMAKNPNFERAVSAVLTFRSMRGECSDLGIEELAGFFTGDSEEASAEILLPMINIFRGLKTTGEVYVLAREEAHIAEAMGIDGSRIKVVSPQELYDRLIEEEYAEGEDEYTWIDDDKMSANDNEEVPEVDNTEEEDEYTWIDDDKVSANGVEEAPEGGLTEAEEADDGYVWEDGEVLERDNTEEAEVDKDVAEGEEYVWKDGDVLERDDTEEVSSGSNEGEEYVWEDAEALERGEYKYEEGRGGVEEPQEGGSDEDVDLKEKIEKIKKYKKTIYEGTVDELYDMYSDMFSPGYELSIPSGMITSGKTYSIKGVSRRNTLRESAGAVENALYSFDDPGFLPIVGSEFKRILGYQEVEYDSGKPVRSVRRLTEVMVRGYSQGAYRVPLYFPFKMLEFAYGRSAPSETELNQNSLNTYKKQSNAKSFDAYWKANNGLKSALVIILLNFLANSLTVEEIEGTDVEAIKKVRDLCKYFLECMSNCVLLTEYDPKSVVRVRVADKYGKLDSLGDVLGNVLTDVFQGSDSRAVDVRTYTSGVKEYCYYYNLKDSQKMPLFAYKAAEVLKENYGLSISWDNLIIGKDESGSILKNGAILKVPGVGGGEGSIVSIDFSKKVFHTISAGSRSGKGVMTLNFLAAAIASGKALMYIDNKPDMASLVKLLGNPNGSKDNPPKAFVVDGSACIESQDNYKQWENRDSFFIKDNVPEWLKKTLGCSWKGLGDLFYLRALKLAAGLAVARITTSTTKYRNSGLGLNDLVVVIDETTQFEKTLRGVLTKLFENHLPTILYLAEGGTAFKGLDSSFSELGMADPNDKKYSRLQREFESKKREFLSVFNEKGAYVSALSNSLISDVRFINSLNMMGIDDTAFSHTDVFILGQELREVPLDSGTVGLIGDHGGFRTGLRSGLPQDVSKPISLEESPDWGTLTTALMCIGRISDAFFGYNSNTGNKYLGQDVKGSRASNWLTGVTRGFAYLPSFSSDTLKVVTKRSTGDSNDVVYFKPYLILNDCKYKKVGGSRYGVPADPFTDKLFANRDDVADIIEENLNNAGDFLDERVGFEAYIKSLSNVQIDEVLAKGAAVADEVVRRLGYVGIEGSNLPLWLQFVTDLRPRWIFSMSDIQDAVSDSGQVNLSQHMSYVNRIHEVADKFRFASECDWLGDFIDVGEEEGTKGFGFSGDVSFEPDGSDLRVDETIEDYRQRVVFDPTYGSESSDNSDTFDENAEIDLFGDSGAEEAPDPYVNTEATNSILEALRVLQSAGIDVSKLNLGLSDKGTINTGYQPALQRVDVSDRFSDRVFSGGGTAESVIQDFDTISDIITELVLDSVGGIDMVESLAEVGGAVAVNGNIFRSQISPSLQSSIPYEVRLKINTGSIADIFDWSVLKKCGNLEKVEFSSIKSLIYNVYESLGVNSLQKVFSALPTVDVIIVKGEVYTRRSIRSDIESSPLYEEKNYVRYAKVTRDWLKKRRNNNWHAIRNIWSNSERGLVSKVLGTGFRVGMLAVSTAAHAGSIGVEAIAKKKSRQSFLKKAGNILKEALKE